MAIKMFMEDIDHDDDFCKVNIQNDDRFLFV